MNQITSGLESRRRLYEREHRSNAGAARRVLATLTARDPHASEHNEGAGELLLREPGGG
jgi:hypothetical protein